MTPILILSLNASTFTLLTFWFYRKSRCFNIGIFILLFYSICSWGAVLYHEHELFFYYRGWESYSIFPFLYLIPALLVFMYPILKFDTSRLERARLLDVKFIITFMKIMLCVQIFLYLILLPSVMKAVMSTNIGNLRNELYDEAEVVKFPFYAANLLCRLYMGARNVCILIASYALLFVPVRRKLVVMFFVTSFCFPLYIFTAYVSRAVMMQQIALSVFILLVLYVFMRKSTRKKIIAGICAFAVPVVIVFNVISHSRFGNLASYMLYRYLGEAFNNYNTSFFFDLKDNTYGSAYLTFFRKIVGLENEFKTTRERWAWLDGITGVDTHVFYTFIGGLNIEFGFVLTIVIGCVLSWLICRALRPYNELTLPKFILVGMLGYTMINGAFCFILQGDWGNLEICFTILLFFVFKKHQSRQYAYRKL